MSATPPTPSNPIMSVYVISNGYLLEIKSDMMGLATLIYAKDEIGIANEITAHATREKLGVGKQEEMFKPDEMGFKAARYIGNGSQTVAIDPSFLVKKVSNPNGT